MLSTLLQPPVFSSIDPLSYQIDDSQMFRPMRDENPTRSPCPHRSGTHNLPTTESRYNFIQVLIFLPFKCEARKADDAIRARDLHRAGAQAQQQCSVRGDVAAFNIAARREDLVAEERSRPMRDEILARAAALEDGRVGQK